MRGVAVLLLLAGSVVGCAATEPDGTALPILLATDEPPAPGEHAEQHPEHEEEEGPNAVNVMLGGAFRRGDGGAFTLGIDYERRLSRLWGVGAYVDLAFGRRFAFVGGAAGYVHPWRDLVLVVGPGFEHEDGDTHALVRLGGFYEWEVGKIWIAPAAYVDIIQHKKPDVILGLNLGWKW